MKRYRVRFARSAREDLDRLTEHLVERSPDRAEDAELAIRDAVEVLKRLPLLGPQARDQDDRALRELLVPFGTSGYLVLYRVGPGSLVSALAARHQVEERFR